MCFWQIWSKSSSVDDKSVDINHDELNPRTAALVVVDDWYRRVLLLLLLMFLLFWWWW
jgi:hypothetical protein